jgi:hypothetical protein
MIEGGRGGHASERENIAPQRKEPENAPDATPFIPKGALIHTKRGTNAHQKRPYKQRSQHRKTHIDTDAPKNHHKRLQSQQPATQNSQH